MICLRINFLRLAPMYLMRPALGAFSESSSTSIRQQPPCFSSKLSGLHSSVPFSASYHSNRSISIRNVKRSPRERSRSFAPSVGQAMSLASLLPRASQDQESIEDALPATIVEAAPGERADECAAQKPAQEDVIVQYIVLRKDLVAGLNWPLGSVISQGCHAAVAAVWLHRDDPVTMKFCASENLDNMHNVTLEVKGEAQLWTMAEKLKAGGVHHKVWIEQPENYATCLATKPYHRSQVASYFKKLKLFK